MSDFKQESLPVILERSQGIRRESEKLLDELRRKKMRVNSNMKKAMLRNRLRGLLLQRELGKSRGKAWMAEKVIRMINRLGLDQRTPEDLKRDPNIVLEAEIVMRYFLMELMNKVGDDSYNKEWGVQGWILAQKMMHRAEIAEHVCERAMKILGVEKLTGEKVVEMGIGNGTSCLPYLARGAEVIGVDASESMVKMAGRIPGVEARAGNPNESEDIYNGIVPGSVLVHLVMGVNRYLSNQGQANLFKCVRRILKERGLFIAGLWTTEREAAVNLWGKAHRSFPWDFEKALWQHGLLVTEVEYVIHGEGGYCPAWILYIRKMSQEEEQRFQNGREPGKTDFKRLKKKRLDYALYEKKARATRQIVEQMKV